MLDGAASRAGGTHAVAWSQTEADGVPSPRPDALAAGVTWRWQGEARRIERPWAPLVLDAQVGGEELRARAARVARRLTRLAPRRVSEALPETRAEAPDGGFLLTDGYRTWGAAIVMPDDGAEPLVAFRDGLPPADADLWIVATRLGPSALRGQSRGGVICFTPGTRLATPAGPRPIEELREGDLVLTADNGPQPVIWTGRRHVSGGRLYAMPHLRPVRIRAAAFGTGRPDTTLSVSPQHRMLVRGRGPRALWNTPEVLVAAADLVDDRLVTVDMTARSVTYIHVLLEAHQIVWANGLETESFHPAHAAEGSLSPSDAATLAARVGDPARYGDPARRLLDAVEAAILRHEAPVVAA